MMSLSMKNDFMTKSDLFNLPFKMSYTIPYSKGLDWKNARKSAEVFVGEIIENKNKENWKLIARLKQEERKNKSVRANRDYRRDKAEKLQRENIILKDKLKLAQMELKILHWETRTEQREQPIKIYWRWIHELI